ncbi:MAG: BREX system P-loop protein BrxC, partial [Candidatus Bathyarchaeia archaeon]
MLIGELFERNPRRPIDPIVKVDQHDPDVVRTELEEYIVTSEIHDYFSDIIDRFIESRSTRPPSVCAWISGFFGSGKSHFLKVLGYVLSNLPIKLKTGEEIRAAPYFCKKHSLPSVHARILERELHAKALFINMLDYDREKGPYITRIVYEALLKDLGFSEVFWIAQIERMMQKRGSWKNFLIFVEKEEGRPWQEARRMQSIARSLLRRGLHKLDPKTYPTEDLAEKAIEDEIAGFSINPSRLAERLLEEAEALDPNAGRLVLLLDEVGLYIGTNTDRLTDLNALAEQITKICQGKVWLFVTAQEALEEWIPKVEARAEQFQWIMDRFQIKVRLTPENIDMVVKKRLLEKSADETVQAELRKIYDDYSGSLALAATIKEPARDYRSLFTELDRKEFIASYPLMPYHVRLMQEIFGLLRSRGRAAASLTGMQRAVLAVVRSILVGVKDRMGLVDRPIGELATFDMVYDAIDEELKAVRSPQQAIMASDIAQLGERNGLRVDSVGKGLFLLQQVREWLPCTPENIAAVLYPKLGVDKITVENAVRECLKALENGKWIAEEEGKYRFLTEVERTFEQLVDSQTASKREKSELVEEVAKRTLKTLKSYNHRKLRTFDVHLIWDDKEITSKGHVKLCFYSPLRAGDDKELISQLSAQSIPQKDTIYWISKADPGCEDDVDRLIRVEKALKERTSKAQSENEYRALERHQREMELLRDDGLPKSLVNAAESGTIVCQGQEVILDGKKKLSEVFNEQVQDVVEGLFTQFYMAAFRLERDEHIGSILVWTGGRLPQIYYDLQLVDEQANILIDRPVASHVLAEVRKRTESDEETTGSSIADHFDAPSYGWDPRIVRLTLATLFRNGSISVVLDGRPYTSPREAGSHSAFTNARAFNRAQFSPGQI